MILSLRPIAQKSFLIAGRQMLQVAVSDDLFCEILRRSDKASKRDAFAAGTLASRF
jgi:hypothetical protein